MHFAAKSGYENIVRALIANGAHINAQDSDGHTPLHFAAEDGSEDVVEILIENRADVNAHNNNQRTPLHFAAKWDYEGVVRFLLENGANSEPRAEMEVERTGCTCRKIETFLTT